MRKKAQEILDIQLLAQRRGMRLCSLDQVESGKIRLVIDREDIKGDQWSRHIDISADVTLLKFGEYANDLEQQMRERHFKSREQCQLIFERQEYDFLVANAVREDPFASVYIKERFLWKRIDGVNKECIIFNPLSLGTRLRLVWKLLWDNTNELVWSKP
jgi:hypothetical protein